MRIIRDTVWTWLLPEGERTIDKAEWIRHGGKWIIFDSRKKILALTEGLGPFIDSGEIRSAKYWNGDPSAINVYSLDREKEKTGEILRLLAAGNSSIWEYDYAWCKNAMSPATFFYSWYSKFRTIIKSYGIPGTLRLICEVLLNQR